MHAFELIDQTLLALYCSSISSVTGRWQNGCRLLLLAARGCSFLRLRTSRGGLSLMQERELTKQVSLALACGSKLTGPLEHDARRNTDRAGSVFSFLWLKIFRGCWGMMHLLELTELPLALS